MKKTFTLILCAVIFTAFTAESGCPQLVGGPINASQVATCAGGQSITYSVALVPGAASYTWQIPWDWQIVSGQGTNSITVLSGTSSGTISYGLTDACSGTWPGTNLNVIQLTGGPITGNAAPCASGQTENYTIDPIVGAVNYHWYLPNGWQIVSGDLTNSITVITGSTNGTIFYQIEDACGYYWYGTTLEVTASAPLQPFIGEYQTEYCMDFDYSFSSYTDADEHLIGSTWTVPSGWTQAPSGEYAIYGTIGNNPGTVTVINENACGTSPMASLDITFGPPALPVFSSGNSVVACSGDDASYSVMFNPQNNGSFVYNWTFPQGWNITAGQGTKDVFATAGISGDVLVSVSDACGTSDTLIIPVSVGILPIDTISGPTYVCPGTTNIYLASTQLGGTFTWTVPSGWTITNNLGGAILVTSGANSGNITAYATYSCGTTPVYTLPVVSGTPPQPVAITGNQTPCTDLATTYSVPEIAGITSYTWTFPSDWVVYNGAGTNSVSVTPGSQTGTISVTQTSACGTSTAQTLSISSFGSALGTVGSITGPGSAICIGQDVVFSIEPVVNAEGYDWIYTADMVIASGQGTNEIHVIGDTILGFPVVQVLVQNGCGNGSAMAFVSVDNSCVVTSIDEAVKSEFTIYPNPNNGVFTINNTMANDYRVELYNSVGQLLVVKQAYQKTTEIDMQNYAAGAYFITLTDGENIVRKKLIRN